MRREIISRGKNNVSPVNRSAWLYVIHINGESHFLQEALMNSVFKFVFIAGLTFLVAAEVAYGQAQTQSYGTNDPGIQQRMQNQEQRIQQGVNSGELTPKEAGRLEAREAKIKQDEARMKADGKLTAKERKRLNKELDNASDRIYKQKHDRQQVKTN
jgi:hypothetical protein